MSLSRVTYRSAISVNMSWYWFSTSQTKNPISLKTLLWGNTARKMHFRCIGRRQDFRRRLKAASDFRHLEEDHSTNLLPEQNRSFEHCDKSFEVFECWSVFGFFSQCFKHTGSKYKEQWSGVGELKVERTCSGSFRFILDQMHSEKW